MSRTVPSPDVARPAFPAALLLPLVGLADWLFWYDAVPGLSLAVFAVALVVTAAAALPERPHPVAQGEAALILLLAVLPVVERVQPLSVLILALGLAGAVLRLSAGEATTPVHLVRDAARLWLRVPIWAAIDLLRAALAVPSPKDGTGTSLVLPVTLGAVFTGLIAVANPVIGDALSMVLTADIEPSARPLLWLLVAVPVWPLLVAWRMAPARPRRARRLTSRFVTDRSVALSLTVFNAIFAVQTSLDLSYLWAGGDLPAGMTYAEYTHRGAYPLVVAAMLAGVFALAAKPFAEERPDLAILLALWLGQTLLLTVSSLYRLELYVDAYGLTYLRVRAAIWMLLVAGGLGLIGWALWRARPTGWVVRRMAVMAGATLYACAFVNFAGLIAGWNLAEGRAHKVDICHATRLGSDAIVPLARNEARTGETCQYRQAGTPAIYGWRDWGYRSHRIRRTLAAMETDE